MLLEHDFPPDLRVENEIESLLGSGHEIHVACITQSGKSSEKLSSSYYIHRKAMSSFIYRSSVAALKLPFYFNFWRRYLEELIHEFDFDAIHIHDLPLGKIGTEIKKKYNIRFTIDLHENWPAYLKNAHHTNTLAGKILSSNRQWEKYELEVCSEADDVIVVIDEARDRLVAKGLPPKKVHIVSNTLNLKSFRNIEMNPSDQEFIIFYAGGIDNQRGLDTVIRSVHLLKDKDVKFLVLGSGTYLKELVTLTEKLAVTDKVDFKGYVSYDKVPLYMSKANAAVIPHLKNEHTDSTIPHKLFQYMYLDLPIVSSDCRPLKRIVEETGTGVIFKNNDPAECSEAILKLMNQRHEEKTNTGKKWVMEKYNWDIESMKLLNIYS